MRPLIAIALLAASAAWAQDPAPAETEPAPPPAEESAPPTEEAAPLPTVPVEGPDGATSVPAPRRLRNR